MVVLKFFVESNVFAILNVAIWLHHFDLVSVKSLELAVSRRIGCCSDVGYLVKIGSFAEASRPSADHVFPHLPMNEKAKISLIKIL